MNGNVREWCSDRYDPTYPITAQMNPTGPTVGFDRVYRGGSWPASAASCRVAHRDYYSPDARFTTLGFRLARSR
jgi:formylglycine-generating enzyme required for sulfatase activity